MKWINKGHELDDYAKRIVEKFEERKGKIYIFGAGFIGKEIKLLIEKTGLFACFIDNDPKKQKNGSEDGDIISLHRYLTEKRQGIIIIAASCENMSIIQKQLMEIGLEKEQDFYDYDMFMNEIFPVLCVYANNQVYVETAQICLTERCTLKCKKCAHGCYAVGSDNKDMTVEMAKSSVDTFFRYVDIVKEFSLLGGEPFLYQDLNEIIRYIGDRYRDKIITYSIYTNGTIIPNKLVLDSCKEYNVIVRISNYSGTLKNLKRKYEKLINELENNHVMFTFEKGENKWVDLGFELGSRNRKESELIKIFDQCKTPCREIRGNRFYYCVMARSVADNLKLELGEDDYLDLEKWGENKKILLEFQLGFSEKGYLDMCDYCNGAEAYKTPIPAAEQV